MAAASGPETLESSKGHAGQLSRPIDFQAARGKDAAARAGEKARPLGREITMIAARRTAIAALACAVSFSFGVADAQTQTPGIQTINGQQYQVTTRMVQVPVQQQSTQTYLTQQVTTQTIQQQQQYSVPVTQYQLVSRLHGRWNPFITPYWTHEYEPVTTWQQQTATVQIPVNTVAWVPQTRNVQTPGYKTVEQLVMTPIVNGPGVTGSQQMMASSGVASTSPSATLVARAPGSAPAASTAPAAAPLSTAPRMASAPTTYATAGIGGTQMTQDPPRGAWQPTTPSTTTAPVATPAPGASYRY
jgi:hypothetical protein